MCACLPGEGKWNKSSASPAVVQKQRHANLLYSRQQGFPHGTFSYYMFRGSRHFAKNITHVRMYGRERRTFSRVPFLCLQQCPAHRSLSLFFFSFPQRHDFLARFHESINLYLSGFPSTILQAKSKIKFFSPPTYISIPCIGVALKFLTSISEIIFVICESMSVSRHAWLPEEAT